MSKLPSRAQVFSITEILEIILDFLEDDCKTLKNSSLVCKSWSLSVAQYLFKRLIVDPLVLDLDASANGFGGDASSSDDILVS